MKTFGASGKSRRNGGVPSALLTAPDKWISLDFSQREAERGRGGGGGRGGRGGPGGAPGGAPGAAPAAPGARTCTSAPHLPPQQALYPTRARSLTVSRWK